MSEKEILKQAKKLGVTIGKSKIWLDFTKASEKFRNDEEIQKLLDDLRIKEKEQSEKIEKGLAIEVEEKRELRAIEGKISNNKTFRDFMMFENKYLALMGEIEKAIKEGTEEAKGKTSKASKRGKKKKESL
jgi:cell fate (sporulation/competence/biofilm development) regulator YlbF (YheA/YmcA/DUF963 family)